MITKLTKEQEAMIPVYRQTWLDYTIKSGPIDKEKCEDAIKWAYNFVNMKLPTKFVYLRSVVECNKAINLLNLGYKLDLDSNISANIQNLLSDNKVKKDIKKNSQTYYYLSSKFWWAGYYCFYDFILNELMPEKRKDFPLLENIKNFIKHSQIFFPFEDIVFVCPNPVEVHFDERGRLHNLNGMSVKFIDGVGIYTLDGIKVSKEIFENVQTKKNAEKIMSIQNTEQRLVAIKYFGAGNLLSELNSKVVDSYKDYTLHEVMIDRNKELLLEMQNPSENKKHYEFVPPEMNTCKKAMAWRIGFDVYSEPKTYS